MPDHASSQHPELLTLTEAAELLRAPVATLRYWRHLGTGPRSFKIGRHVLYRRDDLHTWIDTQQDLATTPTPRARPDARPQPRPNQHTPIATAPNVQMPTSRR